MKIIDWKENTNLDLINQKYGELILELANSLGQDRLKQEIVKDRSKAEEIYTYLDRVYEGLYELEQELRDENELADFNADEVDEEDFEANKEAVKQTQNVIFEFYRLKELLYRNRKLGTITLDSVYLIAHYLELQHELKYSAKRVWCCGRPAVIDRCIADVCVNLYRCIGINVDVVHAGKPVNPKMDITDLILGIKINPYWF